MADSQLTAADTVDFALLLRAIVARSLQEILAGNSIPKAQPTLVDGAIWAAARDGLTGEIIDPLTAQRRSPAALIEQLFDWVEPQLAASGDCGRVGQYLVRRLAIGSPAKLQELAFTTSGLCGVLSLYRDAMNSSPTTLSGEKAG